MKYLIVNAFVLILGSIGGLLGGVIATNNAQTVSAREFVVLDQSSVPRALRRSYQVPLPCRRATSVMASASNRS